MARKEDMSNETAKGDLGVFALNETRIGRNGDNKKRSDIQLIQFFLRQFYKNHPELVALLPKTKSGDGLVAIDGKYGKQTEKGIWLFQKQRRERGTPIKVDGLVNVAHSSISPISRTLYTICEMNKWFRDHGEGKEHHGKLENHPDIIYYAPDLSNELAAAPVGNEF